MNTNDFKPVEYFWPEIFRLQGELQLMYRPWFKDRIENFDINCLEDQELFKKLCWQVTEELIEALEARANGQTDHTKEELIDAMNFLIELYQLVGWDYDRVKDDEPVLRWADLDTCVLNTAYWLGLSANKLKNREWRQSQYLVDMIKFDECFKSIWGWMLESMHTLEMTDRDIRRMWSLKYQVNLFRIKSNY